MEVKILNYDIKSEDAKQGIIICKYCNNKFNTNSILIKHQRIAKYCLVIQGKLEDPSDKIKYEKEEKEKENKRLLNDKKNKKKE